MNYGMPHTNRQAFAAPPAPGYAPPPGYRAYPMTRTGAESVAATPAGTAVAADPNAPKPSLWERTKTFFNGTTLRVPRKYLAAGAVALAAVWGAYAMGWFGDGSARSPHTAGDPRRRHHRRHGYASHRGYGHHRYA